MFTKQQVKEQWFKDRDAVIARGEEPEKAGISLALLILTTSLFYKKNWGGDDYTTHPIHVGFHKTRSSIKQIIGILHDCIEDSDWEIEDLKELGFPERVWKGVDAVTNRDKENYVEFIERCGASGGDAIDVKMEDLEHNSTTTRTAGIAENAYMDLKRDMYNIAYFYLLAIKTGDIEPGSPLIDFLTSHPDYSKTPKEVNKVLERFSDKPDRLPDAAQGLSTSFKGLTHG